MRVGVDVFKAFGPFSKELHVGFNCQSGSELPHAQGVNKTTVCLVQQR